MMVDPTAAERAALRAALKPAAETLEEIGWQTRLCELSEPQVLTLIEVIITGFQDALREYELAATDPEVPF